MVPEPTYLQRELRRRVEASGLTPRAVSLKAGLNETAVKAILGGKSRHPTHHTLDQLAKVLGCTAADLTGQADPRALPDLPPVAAPAHGVVEVAGTEYVSVGRYDAALSAGPGSLMEGDVEPLGYALFERQWLQAVTRASPDHLAIVRVAGDSMENTLHDGDWVLVDRTQTRLAVEGIYAVRVHDVAWVKRVTLNLREKLIRLISDNSAYPVQELAEDELAPIGRVVWIVGRRV